MKKIIFLFFFVLLTHIVVPRAEEFTTPYYTVKLPDGWQAVTKPEEVRGNVNAIFTDGAGTVVTVVMGPLLGAEIKTAADIFAEQFKGDKPVKNKDGSYTFTFKQGDGVTRAIVAGEGDRFKLTTIHGNLKLGQKFLAESFSAPPANEALPKTEKAETSDKRAKPEVAKDAKTPETPAPNAAKEEAKTENRTEKTGTKNDEVYSCKYYEVTLPQGWKAVSPPAEDNGNINAIFANATGSASVSIVVGPSLGTDAKSIAQTFAEQFKSRKPPVERDGQWVFSFRLNGVPARGIVRVAGDEFMFATATGATREIDSFLANSIKSADYPYLMPK